MENQPVLSPEEQNELRESQNLYEMTKTSGFQVLQSWLQDMAYHSWADPRETSSREEWEWRELNSFHAANIARELMERIQTAISRGEYLEKKKTGQIVVKEMKI